MEIDSENILAQTRSTPSLRKVPFGYEWNSISEGDVNLLDYWRVLQKRKLKIALLTLVITFLTFIISSILPKKYKAEVTITPVTSSNSGGSLTSLMSQVNSLPLVGNQLGSLAGEGQKIAQFVTILKSRTLSEEVIKDLHLMPILFNNQWDNSKNNWKSNDEIKIPRLEDGAKVLTSKILQVSEDKKMGMIKLTVLLEDPQLAASIANHYIVRLQDFITHNGLTVAKRNRQFVEAQLQKNKMDYLEFSKKLSEFYTTNQISSVQSKLDVDVGKLETVPQTFEEFREALNALEEQKDKIQNQHNQLLGTERNGVVKNVPAQVYLQYLTLQRDLLGRTNALLLQQYEMAKIQEAKEDLAFQVIDKAIVPRRPAYPNKLLNVAAAFIGGLFISIFYAFFAEHIQKLKIYEKSALK